jgi:hypothetical protein
MSRPRSRWFAGIALLTGALVFAAVLAEIVLRVARIPGITYHTFQYDEVTGQRFYPNTTLIYRSARGEEVVRRVNRWGYLDRNHDDEKAPGTLRIGFFGDSFTEARQVPFDSTFVSRIERGLNAREGAPSVECIAIAMAGYSTLQSYLECHRWMDRLALDRVMYVFCENDPGNHVPSLNMSDAVPYPVLSGDSLIIDRSFATRYAKKQELPHRCWQYLKSHTLLFSTLETRWHLLRSRGVRVRVNETERLMGIPDADSEKVSCNSTPRTLPDSLRALCEDLSERVILTWKTEVEKSGRSFAILYVPRPSETKKEREERDSWAAWLSAFCAESQIDVVDPSERFMHLSRAGDELFYDHLTSRGHAAFARTFLETSP